MSSGYGPVRLGTGGLIGPYGVALGTEDTNGAEEVTTLWVGNCMPGSTDADLAVAMAPFGQMESCFLLKKLSPQGQLSGFVRFKHRDDASRALQAISSGAVVVNGLGLSAKFASKNSSPLKDPALAAQQEALIKAANFQNAIIQLEALQAASDPVAQALAAVQQPTVLELVAADLAALAAAAQPALTAAAQQALAVAAQPVATVAAQPALTLAALPAPPVATQLALGVAQPELTAPPQAGLPAVPALPALPALTALSAPSNPNVTAQPASAVAIQPALTLGVSNEPPAQPVGVSTELATLPAADRAEEGSLLLSDAAQVEALQQALQQEAMQYVLAQALKDVQAQHAHAVASLGEASAANALVSAGALGDAAAVTGAALAAVSPGGPEEVTTLWVGNCSSNTTDSEVALAMIPFGNLESCFLLKKLSPQGQLSGFVRYRTRVEAAIALEAITAGRVVINGSAITGKWASKNSSPLVDPVLAAHQSSMITVAAAQHAINPQANMLMHQALPQARPAIAADDLTTLWVGNLPATTLDTDLQAVMVPFGTLICCFLHKTLSPQGQMSGFARYASKTEASQALQVIETGTIVVHGAIMKAKWARQNATPLGQ